MRRWLLWLGVFVVIGSSLHASCPCITIFCPCCIDRCRLGFAKVSQDGCRDRSALESYTVLLRVSRRGTEVLGMQNGGMSYEAAKALWEVGSGETAPALSSAARDLLGYGSANLDNVCDGSWAASNVSREVVDALGKVRARPLLAFAPLGYTKARTGTGAIVGQVSVLDLSTGLLHETTPEGGLRTRGRLFLNSAPEVPVSGAWLNFYDGRRMPGGGLTADFAVDARNPDFYSWRSCTDSKTCSILFALAAVALLVCAPYFKAFALLVAASAAAASLLVQSLGWYCGIYPCNRTCTYGTISTETRYWVRLDEGGDSAGGTDVVLNNVGLVSRVELARRDSGEYVLSSKHFRGAATKVDGQPVQLWFKGTIVSLGDSAIRSEPEDSKRQMKLLLVPPARPSELLPGSVFGLERKN